KFNLCSDQEYSPLCFCRSSFPHSILTDLFLAKIFLYQCDNSFSTHQYYQNYSNMENHTYSSPLLDKKNPLSSSTASSSLTSSSFSSSSSPPNSSSISTSTNTNTTSSSISYIYTSPNSSTNHSSPAPTLVTSSDTSSNRKMKKNDMI
ncbi:unnamed protein product, partial [Rotaria magnacalcarata]